MANQRAKEKTTTSISLDEALFTAARAKAAASGTNLSAVAGALLRRWLAGDITISEDT